MNLSNYNSNLKKLFGFRNLQEKIEKLLYFKEMVATRWYVVCSAPDYSAIIRKRKKKVFLMPIKTLVQRGLEQMALKALRK